MENIGNKYNQSCHITIEEGHCEKIGDDGQQHGPYKQEVFRKKSRPYGWTNEEFHNWQYPKMGDPYCPKCRRIIQNQRNELAKQDSLDKWFNGLTASQQLAIIEERKAYKNQQEQEDHIRRQKGFVTKGDFKAMQSGDFND